MNAFARARELARALLASQAFHAYQEAEIQVLNDDDLQALATTGDPQGMGEHPVYRRYLDARVAFDRYVTLVLDEVSYRVSATRRSDVPCGERGDAPAALLAEPAFVTARRLAADLLKTQEYRAFAEAEHAFLQDAGVHDLIVALRRDESRLRAFDYASAQEGRELQARVQRYKEALAERDSYARYREARRRFDRLVGEVLDTISLHVTGDQRGETAACGTGGGLCGCGSGLDLPPEARIRRVLTAV